ncbi:MAG: hypothetical protein GMKNLPBB_02536 [Myxococcota bacterium]|nr:hypothetical protein [Myxococcota bacterium]
MDYNLLRGLHIFFDIVWIGAFVGHASAFFVQISQVRKPDEAWAKFQRGLFLKLSIPAQSLALATGIWMITEKYGMGIMKQGWFHGKLTLIIGLWTIEGMLAGMSRRYNKGEGDPPAPNMVLAMLAAILMDAFIVVLMVTVLRYRMGGA